eukprot:355524-Chlamydomonas_euryale.AAC.43
MSDPTAVMSGERARAWSMRVAVFVEPTATKSNATNAICKCVQQKAIEEWPRVCSLFYRREQRVVATRFAVPAREFIGVSCLGCAGGCLEAPLECPRFGGFSRHDVHVVAGFRREGTTQCYFRVLTAEGAARDGLCFAKSRKAEAAAADTDKYRRGGRFWHCTPSFLHG